MWSLGTSLIRYERGAEGWITFQMARDGKLSVPIDVHVSARRLHQDADDWERYLENTADKFIRQFGDARTQPFRDGSLERM